MDKTPHPLIVKAKECFNEKYLDRYGCYNLKYQGGLSLRCTPLNSDRAQRDTPEKFK